MAKCHSNGHISCQGIASLTSIKKVWTRSCILPFHGKEDCLLRIFHLVGGGGHWWWWQHHPSTTHTRPHCHWDGKSNSSSQSSTGLSIVIVLNRSHNSTLSLKCTIVFRSLLIHCVLEILQPHLHPHPPEHLRNHLADKLFSVHYLPIVSQGYTL